MVTLEQDDNKFLWSEVVNKLKHDLGHCLHFKIQHLAHTLSIARYG